MRPLIFGTIKRKLDYEEAGGAPLLGLEKSCLVAHGASSVNALRNAIVAAETLVKTKLIEEIESSIQQHADLGLWPKGRSAEIEA